MKRTPISRGTKPLARTPFKSKLPGSGPSFSGLKPEVKRKTLKAKRSKMTPIRASARGEACTLRLPCCNFDPATTVWCHSNRAEDGKGMGLKARDAEGCYGCHACHAFLDGGYAGHMPRSLLDTYFDLARKESQRILKTKGLIP